MKTIRILGLAVAIAAAAPLLSVPHASAQPVPGATYTGDITGCAAPPCGTVYFTVSGDASQVEGFTASDVPGDNCQFPGPQSYPVPLDIVGNSFGPGIPEAYEVSGSFSGGGTAEGTVRLVLDEPPCDSGVLDWTAVSSFPPSPVGGIAELPDASGSSRPDHLALAGLAAAALAALVGAGWYAGRRST